MIKKIITIGILLTFCLSALASINAIAESGSTDVSAGSAKYIEFGFLYTGTTIDYSWYTDDSGDKLDSYIYDDSDNKFQEVDNTASVSKTFTVPADDKYYIYWYCDNWFDTASIEYSYTITEPAVDSDLTVSYTFSNNPCPQAESGQANITIKNPNDDQIKVTWVGIHFDFQPTDIYYVDGDVKASPETLASSQEFQSTVSYSVEKDTSLGMHIYDIRVDYEIKAFGNWHQKNWLSGDKLDFSVTERDRDGDGTPDSEDAFPDNADEQKDTDEDGYGDNQDTFPTDPAEWKDTDGDGVGDNADAFPDNKDETKDSDNDGIGDNKDAFPNDETETEDTDGDGVGDNADAFPDDEDESEDTDGDGVGDNADAFKSDPAASIDTDSDGYPDEWNEGKTKDDSTSDLKIDKYPENADKWKEEEKSPGFGVILVIFVLAILGLMSIITRNRKK